MVVVVVVLTWGCGALTDPGSVNDFYFDRVCGEAKAFARAAAEAEVMAAAAAGCSHSVCCLTNGSAKCSGGRQWGRAI